MGALFWGRVAWHREQMVLQKVSRARGPPPGYYRQVHGRAGLGQAQMGSDWAPNLCSSAYPVKPRPFPPALTPMLTLLEATAFRTSGPSYLPRSCEEPISQQRRLRPTEVNGVQEHRTSLCVPRTGTRVCMIYTESLHPILHSFTDSFKNSLRGCALCQVQGQNMQSLMSQHG